MLSDKQWQPRLVMMLAALIFLSLSGAVLAAKITLELLHTHISSQNLRLVSLVLSVTGFHLTALVLIHFFLLKHETNWAEGFGFAQRNTIRCIALTVAALPVVLAVMLSLGAVSQWLLSQIAEATGWNSLKPELQPAVRMLQEDWPVYFIVLQGIIALLIAPLAEEVIFRGILYTALKQRTGLVLAALISSVLFAAIHFYPAGFLSLLFLSLAAVWLYERTRNLLAPILLHALFNTLNFVVIVTKPKWAEELLNV
jgi:membrane protease YdiL (CAAX protease family)